MLDLNDAQNRTLETENLIERSTHFVDQRSALFVGKIAGIDDLVHSLVQWFDDALQLCKRIVDCLSLRC